MNFASVLAFKQEVLAEINQKLIQPQSENLVEAILDQTPAKRIAVGYSQIKKNQFRLELRVQRRDRSAYRYAEAIVERARGDANLEIIPKIEIPSINEVRKTKPCTPIVERGQGALQLGMSIGPRDSGVGTLGAFLSRPDGDYILSCQHVMVAGNPGTANRRDPIFHPGREIDFQLDANCRIAGLENFVYFSRDTENQIDCAIAKLDSDWDYDMTRIPLNTGYPNEGKPITLMKNPEERLTRDTVMCKIGRSTCYTQGLLRAIDLDQLTVHLHGQGNLVFSNIIEIRSTSPDNPFSLAGDSGGLVFTEDLQAVGLVFAGGMREDGHKVSYVCRLDSILTWAKADLLTEAAN
jgi:hypothetical protein